jgi:hypothetical protein
VPQLLLELLPKLLLKLLLLSQLLQLPGQLLRAGQLLRTADLLRAGHHLQLQLCTYLHLPDVLGLLLPAVVQLHPVLLLAVAL